TGFGSGLRVETESDSNPSLIRRLSLPRILLQTPIQSQNQTKPFPFSMSLKPSISSQNLMLPVSDPPSNQDDYADDKLFRGSAMTKRGAFAAVSYMSCAVLLVMFNKAALSSYNFPSANVITLLQVLDDTGNLEVWKDTGPGGGRHYNCQSIVVKIHFFSFHNLNTLLFFVSLQMVCSCCFLYLLKRWRMISFSANESLLISDTSTKFVSVKTLKHTLPLSGAYLFYMLVTMESVRGVNVPMYTTLRRTTVVFTMLVEFALVGQRYTRSVILRLGICYLHLLCLKVSYVRCPAVISVGLIVFGAFVAGARDFSFDAYGYAVVFMSNIATAIYLATISRIGKTSGLNSFGLMWCNGIICGPVLLIWTFVRGDLKISINFPYLFSPGFMVILLFSCILAFFLNYCIFLNTTLNSAVTQTICGNLKVVSGDAVKLCFHNDGIVYSIHHPFLYFILIDVLSKSVILPVISPIKTKIQVLSLQLSDSQSLITFQFSPPQQCCNHSLHYTHPRDPNGITSIDNGRSCYLVNFVAIAFLVANPTSRRSLPSAGVSKTTSPLFFSMAHHFNEFFVLSRALILPSTLPTKPLILPSSTSPFGSDSFLTVGSGCPLLISLDLFTIGLGWIIFGGLPFDIVSILWNISGQFLGFAGSGLYAYYKLIGK
ncbi:hypothetical protein V8G54_035061, partial [Vigna mungo]